jgi:predicted nuclease of predicted toxin-antitoxin system
MKLLVDMNLSPRWVPSLEQAGIQAMHWIDIGAPNAPDIAIMAEACARGAVVLTHDLDFGAMLATGGATGPSVIQLRLGEVTPESSLTAVVDTVHQFAAELTAGALITLDARRSRVSLLPLRH